MQRARPITWIILATLTAGVGCEQRQETSATASPPPLTNSPAYGPLDHAMPRLKTVNLWVGPQVVEAEVASTITEISTGMMYRKDMGENEGMLFVFARPHQATFYMKNTVVPLSAAYISSDGSILEIHDLQPLNEEPVPSKTADVQFVLEMKQGWFNRNQINPGTLVRTEFGSLLETFQRRR